MRPLCGDLARRGFAALNVEYRRLGREGGGWPQTFDDVAAAIDHLADLAMRDADLDLERVTMLGHSAGGQLALWAAGRDELPAGAPGAGPRVVADRVLALAAVCDLEAAGPPPEPTSRWPRCPAATATRSTRRPLPGEQPRSGCRRQRASFARSRSTRRAVSRSTRGSRRPMRAAASSPSAA